jgi:hypothetical protein
MEERVKVCRSCKAIVGWFAVFCETCGAKQQPQDARKDGERKGAPKQGTEPKAPAPAPMPKAPDTLEHEIRTHLEAPPTDAKSVARDLFRTQLRLIHRHREGVETLIRDVEAMQKNLAAASQAPHREAARRALDHVSERMFEAEQRWGELQVSYNRDSEAIEEEGREMMETADIDAYLSPDENAKIEGEFAALTGRFETVDALLRDTGRAIALARQGAESRYLGAGGRGGALRLVFLLVTAGLVAWSMYSALFQYKEDPIRVATTIGPVLVALGLWVIIGFSRRAGG